MNARLLSSHLAVAILAFGLGYAVFSYGEGKASSAGKLQRLDDPVAALTDALRIEDAPARTQALLDFFAAADPAWAERLRAEVNQPGSELILDEIGETLFAQWWAKSDPEAAFKNIVDPAWANRHPWIREVMRAWVASDPSRAAEATASLPPNPDRGQVEATRILVQHWWDKQANSDPGPLLVLIHKLEVVPRASAIHILIQNSIKKRGIDVTEKFVESLPQADALGVDVPQEMLGRYGQALLDVDVERAKRWAEKHGQGRDGAGILRHLAFSWGVKDGAAAMDWATGLPDSPQRAGIILRVWLSYRQAHPDESRDWLLAHEPTEVLEHIYSRYLTGTAGDDVEKALELAGRAKDLAVRDRLLAAVGTGWIQKDPEAAKKWLDSVELAPELKERVLRAMPLAPAVQSIPAAAG